MYTVYKTVNLVNQKYYIGVHKTVDPLDDYLGCGIWKNQKLRENLEHLPFYRAVKKYGVENFKKQIIQIFTEEQEAYKLEKELINLTDDLCYNVKRGGIGGFAPTINLGRSISNLTRKKMSKAALNRKCTGEHLNKWVKENVKGKKLEEIYGEEKATSIREKKSESAKGKVFSKETREKLSQSRKNKPIVKNQGRKKVLILETNKFTFLPKDTFNKLLEEGKIVRMEIPIYVSKYQKLQYYLG